MKSKFYELIYKTGEDGGRYLAEIIPGNGVMLYEILATYAKSQPCSVYRILAKSPRKAKSRFLQINPWLTVKSVREIPLDSEEARLILTDWRKMPVW